ncbi:hypothetical protein CI610_01269 [invertebrate metagenome]|uniref:Uncharacterized protein n=1 Tax=invertebrate metagenome TaxID=1711999 RepID=A0A2H9T994_9ZZZZ
MADNIINPKDLAKQDGGALEDFVTPDDADSEEAERFKNLMSGNDESDQTKLSETNVDSGAVQAAERISGNRGAVDQVDRIDQPGLLEKEESITGILSDSVESVAEPTMGDKILQGFQNVRDHVEKGAQEVGSHLSPAGETMSMREMFQTQMAMTNLMITEDYIGKVVSKGTQAFDSLLRNQ